MNRTARALTVGVMTLMLLAISAPAFAHVTVRTDNPAPEAFAKYTVRVPNESDTEATVKVEVQLPDTLEAGSYQPVPGWDIAIEDGTLTIEGGRIEPGQFMEFSFSARNPAEAGELTFPSIQTYSDGEEVGWVGEPDSDEPAPVVTIEGEAGGHGGSDGDGDDATTEPATEDDEGVDIAADDGAERDGGDSADPLSIVALIAGSLGLVLGGAAFAKTRG